MPHESDDFGCELLLPATTVELTFSSPATDFDRVRVVLNENDKSHGPVPVAEEVVAEGEPDWELYHGLYQEATKRVFHWDRVIGELESAVNKAGKIGLTHEQAGQLVHANR